MSRTDRVFSIPYLHNQNYLHTSNIHTAIHPIAPSPIQSTKNHCPLGTAAQFRPTCRTVTITSNQSTPTVLLDLATFLQEGTQSTSSPITKLVVLFWWISLSGNLRLLCVAGKLRHVVVFVWKVSLCCICEHENLTHSGLLLTTDFYNYKNISKVCVSQILGAFFNLWPLYPTWISYCKCASLLYSTHCHYYLSFSLAFSTSSNFIPSYRLGYYGVFKLSLTKRTHLGCYIIETWVSVSVVLPVQCLGPEFGQEHFRASQLCICMHRFSTDLCY